MDVESKFNPLAEGDSGDTGILQIRQIYVDEANRILGRKEFTLMDAYDIDRSLDIFDTVQSHHNSDILSQQVKPIQGQDYTSLQQIPFIREIEANYIREI